MSLVLLNYPIVTSSLFVMPTRFSFPEITPVTFDTEIADLRQQRGEYISAYYARTVSLLQKYRAPDRSPEELMPLAQSYFLDTFLRAWIRGLRDILIKHKATEGI